MWFNSSLSRSLREGKEIHSLSGRISSLYPTLYLAASGCTDSSWQNQAWSWVGALAGEGASQIQATENKDRCVPGSPVTVLHEPLSCSGCEVSVGLETAMAFTCLCSELPEKGVHPASSPFVGPHPLATRSRSGNLAPTALKGDPNRTVTPSFPEQKSKRG